MRKIQFIGVLLVILALVLGACGKSAPTPAPSPAPAPQPLPAPAPQPSGWDAVLAAAKKEGTVTLYNVLGNQLGDAIKAGMKQYGIDVQFVTGSGGEMELKVVTEQRAKAYVADVFDSGWNNINNIVKQGNAQPVTVELPSLAEKGVWRVDPGKFDSTKSAYAFGTSLTPSVVINTDLVRPGEITSWQDLLDPKWKGKMVMTDPRTGSGPGSSGMGAWLPKLGEDFFKKLATQNVSLLVSYNPVVDQVTYGDKAGALFPAFSRTVAAIQAGAPIQIVHLKEGVSYYINGVAFIKNAPHPNAAMVLLNWMFSKEGQAAIGKATNNDTVRSDVPETWVRIKELNPNMYTLLEPPNNLDPSYAQKAVEAAKKVWPQ